MTIKSCPFTINNKKRILWEITNRCNLKCRHCLRGTDLVNMHADIPITQVATIIDEIRGTSQFADIWLSGGEPLLREDIIKICWLISNAGMRPSLSTNGTLVTDSLSKDLHKAGVNYAHVSIDGVTASVHDALRGVIGSFNKTIEGVHHLRNNGIRVGATYMVTSQSIDDVPKMVEMANSLDLQVLSFYFIEPMGKGISCDTSDRLLLNERLSCIYKSIHNSSTTIEVFRMVDKVSDGLEGCVADKFYTISPSGVLSGCPWYTHSMNNCFGVSLNNTSFDSAVAIVENEMKKVVDEQRNRTCIDCRYNDSCGKGCPALTDKNGRDYICGLIN